MSTDERRNWLRKLGCAFSLFFGLLEAYTLFRLVIYGHQRFPRQMFVFGSFTLQVGDLVFFLVILILAGLIIYEDLEMWKPWAALFGGPGIRKVVDLLSLSVFEVRIAANIVSVVLTVYAFIAFAKHLRQR